MGVYITRANQETVWEAKKGRAHAVPWVVSLSPLISRLPPQPALRRQAAASAINLRDFERIVALVSAA
jgi:hypothetical protein